MALDSSQSSGQGAWVFPVGTERGAPLRARVYKFDPMLREVVASPSQSFSWTLPRVIPGIGMLNGCVLVRCVSPKTP